MISPQAFTHGPETANPAKKGRIRSSCEALGQQAFGRKPLSPAIRSNGSMREAVGMSWRSGRCEVIAACLLLAGCGPELDYGQCLQSHTRPASIQMLPMPDGQGGITFMYIPQPEEEVCDQWEYPEGRHIMEGVGK